MSQSEGFVAPPPTDRELSVEIVREVLREQFPQLAVQSDELRGLMPLVPQLKDLAPDAWAWFDLGPAVPRDYSGPPRFIYDCSPHHIIVSLSTDRLSGLIDCEARLGDPAHDLSELVLIRGPAFLKRALASYALPVDAELVGRAIFLGRVRALAWLAGATRVGDGPMMLETVRWAFTD